MKKENLDPYPSLDDTNIFSIGPISPTNIYEVYKPIPVPCLFMLWLLNVAYGWPILFYISRLIPTPVSMTEM
jgi:hypothetical protein